MFALPTFLHLRSRPPMALLLLAWLALLPSCTEDSFSQLVDVPLPKHIPQPLLSLDLIAGDTAYLPIVGRSYGILDNAPIEKDQVTQLRLFRDNVLISERSGYVGDYLENAGPNREDQLVDSIVNDGATYRAVIEIQGTGGATATQIMPARPQVEVISYVKDGAVDIDGYRRDVINVAIDDPAGSDDYYQFRVLRKNSYEYCNYDSLGTPVDCMIYVNRSEFYVSSPDPTLRRTGDATVGASDRSFNGTRREFRLEVDNYDNDNDDNLLTVVVDGLTDDGFRYLTSRYAAEEADGNPFAEPVTVHGNIEGGVGIFMVSSRATALVKM